MSVAVESQLSPGASFPWVEAVDRIAGRIRYRTFRAVRLYGTILGIPNALLFLLVESQLGKLSPITVSSVTTEVAFVATSWIFTERTHRLGAAFLILVGTAIACQVVFIVGLTPGVSLLFGWSCVACAAFYGKRAALAAFFGLAALLMVYLAWRHLAGGVLGAMGEIAPPTIPVLVRYATGFLAMLGLLLTTVLAIVGGLAESTRELTGALERERLAHQARQAEQEHYATIFNASHDALFVHDVRGRITAFNETAAELYGIGQGHRAELELVRDLLGPGNPVEGLSSIWERVAQGDRVRLEWNARRLRDGSCFPAEVWLQRVRLGEEPSILASVRDITERRQAEEALRTSGARLRGILDNLQDAYMQVDLSGRYTVVSPSAVTMYGYGSVEEMVGLPAEGFYADPRDRESVLDDLRRSGRVHDWVGRGKRKDGTTFWVSMNAQVYRDANGQIAGTEGVIRDISERKKAEEELRQMQANLAQSDRLVNMGLLAAGVAHEINNPLSYVLYNLESLSDDLPRYGRDLAAVRQALAGLHSEGATKSSSTIDLGVLDVTVWTDVADRLKEALSGLHKIKAIVHTLGTFSRVEKEQATLVDLRYPIESALRVAFNEIKYRARVEKEFSATAPVLASDGRLSQVFLNLLVNAAHAIPEGDVESNRILIRTWQEDATVLVEVQDTGCGIAAEDLERIFEPFFTTKPVGVGSGLGLSIVRSIVEGYGGTITATSSAGKGSRFVVRLPAATREPSREEDGAAASTEAAPVTRGRILVIDDEPGIRRALKRMLGGHEVIEANSGDEACELLVRDQRFDVILCDMMMPKMSGMDVHRWLMERFPRLARRLVFVTGGAFTPNAREYLEKVENLRIEKPFDAVNVRKIITQWVRAARTSE